MKTKNYLRGILLAVAIFLGMDVVNTRMTNFIIRLKQNKVDISVDTIKGLNYTVTATMYYPVAFQCDSDPYLTAGMYRIPKNASDQKWIAMSRDMIARWGGEFHYGDFVEIKGAGHKDGVYQVVDTMNKRFKSRIDFLENTGTKPYKFTNVTLTKIQWKIQTPKENLLASL